MPTLRKRAKRPSRLKAFVKNHAMAIRRALLCVLVFALLAALPVFVNTFIGYVPPVAYLFLLLLSFSYLRLVRRGLRFDELEMGSGCIRGERLALKFVVHNRSFLPAVHLDVQFYISDLFGGEGATAHRRVTLPPRSSKEIAFEVRLDHIGEYSVGVNQVVVWDLLGLFWSTFADGALRQVTVQPRIFEVASLTVSSETASESKKNITTVINDGMDYCGIREYVWGDPIKTIHWKLSAKAAEDFYTRLYETVCNPGLAIIADFEAPAYTSEELMEVYDSLVETVFSLESYTARNGLDAELLFAADGATRRFAGPFGDGAPEVLARMPRIGVGDGLQALEVMQREAASIYSQSNLALCTANVTAELVSALVAVKSNKRMPLLFAIVPHGAEEAKRKELAGLLLRLSSAGVAYVIVSDSAELEEADL